MDGQPDTGVPDWLSDTESSYDGVADGYADLVRGAVAAHPWLRAALGLFADAVAEAGGGSVADVGCGPGHVTRYLSDLGVDAFGIDLSSAMIDLARREHPGLRFEVGSMTDLALPAGSVTGLLAWQSLIHVPDRALPGVLSHFARVLRPGGALQLLFHVGEEPRHLTQGYGGAMNVWVHPRTVEQVGDQLLEVGFTVEAELQLAPRGARPQAFLFARR